VIPVVVGSNPISHPILSERTQFVMNASRCFALAALLAASTLAIADERSDYYQRVAARDLASFHELDVDHRGFVTREDIVGDNDFGPRFTDMDVNRDGVVTLEELARYIRLSYGVEIPADGKATAVTQHVEGTAARPANGKQP
jgi:hypothetical protein